MKGKSQFQLLTTWSRTGHGRQEFPSTLGRLTETNSPLHDPSCSQECRQHTWWDWQGSWGQTKCYIKIWITLWNMMKGAKDSFPPKAKQQALLWGPCPWPQFHHYLLQLLTPKLKTQGHIMVLNITFGFYYSAAFRNMLQLFSASAALYKMSTANKGSSLRETFYSYMNTSISLLLFFSSAIHIQRNSRILSQLKGNIFQDTFVKTLAAAQPWQHTKAKCMIN